MYYYSRLKNKGVEIRNKKRQKKSQKAREIKENQIGLCRFILFRNTEYEIIHGKTSKPKFIQMQGLQIENKFYYVNSFSELKWCYINKHGAKILYQYKEDELDWVSDILKEKYNKFISNTRA